MVRVHPRLPLFHTRASFNGSGYPATNRETGGSNPPARTISGPSSNGEGAALRRLRFRFDPGRAVQFRSVDRLARCPAVDRKQTSSILVRSANFMAMWTSGLSRPPFKRVIAGSNPAIAAIGLKLMRMSRRFLIVRQRVRFSPGQPNSCRVAELVQRSIVNREDVGSSPTPTARYGREMYGAWADL
jgi:hypothetical protein